MATGGGKRELTWDDVDSRLQQFQEKLTTKKAAIDAEAAIQAATIAHIKARAKAHRKAMMPYSESMERGAYKITRKKHKYDALNSRFVTNVQKTKQYKTNKPNKGLIGIPGDKGHAVAIIDNMLFNANDAHYLKPGDDYFTTPDILKRYERPLMLRRTALHHSIDNDDGLEVQGCCALIAGAIINLWKDKSLTKAEKMSRALNWSGQRLLETYSPIK